MTKNMGVIFLAREPVLFICLPVPTSSARPTGDIWHTPLGERPDEERATHTCSQEWVGGEHPGL